MTRPCFAGLLATLALAALACSTPGRAEPDDMNRSGAVKPAPSSPPAAAPTEAPAAIARLSSEHAAERAEAMATLEADIARARPALRRLVTDGRPAQGAIAALRVFGAVGDPQDVPLLRAALESGGALAWEAARALGRHPADDALRALLAGVESAEAPVAEAALASLPDREEPAARRALEAALAHPDPKRRFKAAVALQRAGAGPSRAAIEARLAVEPDPEVRAKLEAAKPK